MAIYLIVAGSTPSASGLFEDVDGLKVDFATVARQGFTQTIGNGTDTAITVTHNLNTRNLNIEVYRNSAPFDTVEVDVDRSVSANAILLTFAVAPTTNQYTVVINPVRGN